jgi:hypothetical protein
MHEHLHWCLENRQCLVQTAFAFAVSVLAAIGGILFLPLDP